MMFVISVYAGYFGVGFGFMMLSLLSLSKLKVIHEMNLLKNLSGVVTLSVTVIILLNGRLISWQLGIFMAVGNGLGGYLASKTAPKIKPTLIRYVVICFGLLTSAYFLFYDRV